MVLKKCAMCGRYQDRSRKNKKCRKDAHIAEINCDPPLPTVHCRFVPGKVHVRAQNVINTVTDWIKVELS